METITLGLLLLAAVLISAVVDQLVPRISLPLIQIAMGVIIAIFASSAIDIELDPEVFLVFFIAPLLYDEAKNADKALLWRDLAPILALAIGLVVVTALAIGFTVNALLPPIALAAAFALGGALGPTDAVAVSSLSEQVEIPGRQKSILKGELLLNDASGIVTFQFAIAVALGGVFSLGEAVGDFCIEFFGGLLFGAVLGIVFNAIVRGVRAIGVENTTFHVLFEVLTPFIIYLISDACGVSGVIAVVVAGLVNVIAPRMAGPSVSRMNIVSSSVWRVLTFALNGIVFVLLGTQLPSAMRRTWEDATINNGVLILIILLITLVLYAVRFAWMIAMEYFHVRRKEKRRFTVSDLKATLVATLGGAKGTITLSILFTIPVTLADGTRFPQRDLIIFLACGVILCTLLIATFVVPLLAPKRDLKQSEIDIKQRDIETSMDIIRNVIEELNAHQTPENRRETQTVIMAYNNRLAQIKNDNKIDDEPNIELRLQALQWEQDRTNELVNEGAVSQDIADQYIGRLEQAQRLLKHRGNRVTLRRTWMRLRMLVRRIIRWFKNRFSRNNDSAAQEEELTKLNIATGEYVIDKLNSMVSSADVPTEDVTTLLSEYQTTVARNKNTLESGRAGANRTTMARDTEKLNIVKQYAYSLEIEQIQLAYEEDRLSRSAARHMRENVTLMQLDAGDAL